MAVKQPGDVTGKNIDVLYENTNGQWQLKKGFYRKLRIPPEWARDCLLETGFQVTQFNLRNGMATIIARKPQTP